MTWDAIMETPITVFWLLNKNIPRLMAEEDIRRFDCMAATQQGDKKAVQQFRQGLVLEMGPIASDSGSEELDRDGLNELRGIAGGA